LQQARTTKTTRNAGLGRKIETKSREQRSGERRKGEEKCKAVAEEDGETRRDVENAVHIKNAKISLKLTTNRVLVRASVCECVCVWERDSQQGGFLYGCVFVFWSMQHCRKMRALRDG